MAVWISGFRLSRFAGAIARKTGIGEATIGVLLLGGVISLPEIAVAGSAVRATGRWRSPTCWLASPCRWQSSRLPDAFFRRGALTRAVPALVTVV